MNSDVGVQHRKVEAAKPQARSCGIHQTRHTTGETHGERHRNHTQTSRNSLKYKERIRIIYREKEKEEKTPKVSIHFYHWKQEGR